jgi:hypothetical protein
VSTWKEAAKWVGRFPEGVITGVGPDGYPVSVRQLTSSYDPSTGELPLVVPESLGLKEGKGCFICHFHNEKMWDLRAILLKGEIVRREGQLRFVTKSFTPPSELRLIGDMRKSMNRYLEKRGLPRPSVNWTSIARIWKRARQVENP